MIWITTYRNDAVSGNSRHAKRISRSSIVKHQQWQSRINAGFKYKIILIGYGLLIIGSPIFTFADLLLLLIISPSDKSLVVW